MNAAQIEATEDELERLDCIIKAAEDWGEEYQKAPDTHEKLIRTEARLERKLRGFYRELANIIVTRGINWYSYNGAVRAEYSVDVIVSDLPIEESNQTFISVIFEELAVATAVGALAGEVIYDIPLGIQSTDAIIQQLTTQQVGSLVGKSVDKETGRLIDNPKAKYRVSNKLREDIRQSIQTSINLGEDQAKATERLTKVVKNPKRAALIAQTETVNAYQAGLDEFGRQSGAIGKIWQTVGAVDICAVYAKLGPVPFSYRYGGRILGPTAHPRCRCGRRLLYPGDPEAHKIKVPE